MGKPAASVTVTPLLHLFLSYAGFVGLRLDTLEYQPWGLFFGRLERYKGLSDLLVAATMLHKEEHEKRLVLAGPGSPSGVDLNTLSPCVEVRNRLVQDAEAVDLFQRCGVLVLPYLDATQSALIPAAYYFSKPVIVSRTGALPEYVQEGTTGWVVPPGNPAALAACLSEAHEDPARLQRMGHAGRAWYDDQRRREGHTLRTMYESAAASTR
jgi:glycosyltransferase involved in cell wall biosynthesis